MKSAVLASILGLFALTAQPALAQSGHMDHSDHAAPADQAATETAALSEGTVRKIDRAAGKLTIAHGPLKNLAMPPMTMTFKVSDPAMLDKVQAGDKVRFMADRIEGAFTVTKLEAAR